jgi:L-glutamine-phosphate cytidylyltransferase
MKALILAAGRGRRLWPFTVDRPKCLLPLQEISILEHQLLCLEQSEVEEAVMVCGFGIDRVRRVVSDYPGRLRTKILHNPFYAVADNLVSLWIARAELDGELLLLNGDGVFHSGIFQRLLAAADECCLMIARKARYDEDDMKLQLRQGRIVKIGKDLVGEETDAESVGMMRFSGAGAGLLRQAIEAIADEPQASRRYFLDSVQRLIDSGHPVTYRETDGLPWADIDTPDDLRFVRQHLHLYQTPSLGYGKAGGGV